MINIKPFRVMWQMMTTPQATALIGTLLLSDMASARAPLGMPDPSLMPLWGAAAVVGVIAYRLKKRK